MRKDNGASLKTLLVGLDQLRGQQISFAFALAILVAFAWTLLFTQRGFASDFTNTIWLGSSQAATVTHGLLPTYFTNTIAQAPLQRGFHYPYLTTSMFNPVYAFYGGPLFVVLGYLTVFCAHNVLVAFCLLTVMAMGAAYFGIYRIARIVGCTMPCSHAAAITFTGSAYYLADLYGRGDWVEFVAVSSIPLLAYSAADLLGNERVRRRSIVLLFVATGFFTGSHNTTLLWGSIFLLLVVGLLVATRTVKRLSIRRTVIGIACIACGVGLNCWALFPALAYSSTTYFAKSEAKLGTPFIDTFQNLFNPLRAVPAQSSSPGLFAQVPLWMLLWAVIVGSYYCVWRRTSHRLTAFWLGLIALLGFYLFLMMNHQIWNHLPHLFSYIQNQYLLSTYVALTVVALVIVVGACMARTSDKTSRGLRLARAGLGVGAAVSFGLAVWQVFIPNDEQSVMSYTDRRAALVSPYVLPHSWYAQLDYVDEDLPVVNVSASRELIITPRYLNAHGDSYEAILAAPNGIEPIATNIAAAPDFVHIGGSFIAIGRTIAGDYVLQRKVPGFGDAQIIVTTTRSPAIVAGQLVTEVSAAIALLVLLGLVVDRVRTRKRPARLHRSHAVVGS